MTVKIKESHYTTGSHDRRLRNLDNLCSHSIMISYSLVLLTVSIKPHIYKTSPCEYAHLLPRRHTHQRERSSLHAHPSIRLRSMSTPSVWYEQFLLHGSSIFPSDRTLGHNRRAKARTSNNAPTVLTAILKVR